LNQYFFIGAIVKNGMLFNLWVEFLEALLRLCFFGSKVFKWVDFDLDTPKLCFGVVHWLLNDVTERSI
jgi:hypothetical protein